MLRLFYLSVTGVFGLLRLLPVSDRDKPDTRGRQDLKDSGHRETPVLAILGS